MYSHVSLSMQSGGECAVSMWSVVEGGYHCSQAQACVSCVGCRVLIALITFVVEAGASWAWRAWR